MRLKNTLGLAMGQLISGNPPLQDPILDLSIPSPYGGFVVDIREFSCPTPYVKRTCHMGMVTWPDLKPVPTPNCKCNLCTAHFSSLGDPQ